MFVTNNTIKLALNQIKNDLVNLQPKSAPKALYLFCKIREIVEKYFVGLDANICINYQLFADDDVIEIEKKENTTLLDFGFNPNDDTAISFNVDTETFEIEMIYYYNGILEYKEFIK